MGWKTIVSTSQQYLPVCCDIGDAPHHYRYGRDISQILTRDDGGPDFRPLPIKKTKNTNVENVDKNLTKFVVNNSTMKL
jgi:hypothetical protein